MALWVSTISIFVAKTKCERDYDIITTYYDAKRERERSLEQHGTCIHIHSLGARARTTVSDEAIFSLYYIPLFLA